MTALKKYPVTNWLGLRRCHLSKCSLRREPGISFEMKALKGNMTLLSWLWQHLPALMYSLMTLQSRMKCKPLQKLQVAFQRGVVAGPEVFKVRLITSVICFENSANNAPIFSVLTSAGSMPDDGELFFKALVGRLLPFEGVPITAGVVKLTAIMLDDTPWRTHFAASYMLNKE